MMNQRVKIFSYSQFDKASDVEKIINDWLKSIGRIEVQNIVKDDYFLYLFYTA